MWALPFLTGVTGLGVGGVGEFAASRSTVGEGDGEGVGDETADWL